MSGNRFGAFLIALALVLSGLPASAKSPLPLDVLVVGGTPAGVAAAIAAARRGANVTLVSRRPELGGVLTDAMMDQWDLNIAPDGRPVESGIFSEIYALLGDSFTPADAARTFAGLVDAEPRIHVIANALPVAVTTADVAGLRRVDDIVFDDTGAGPRFALHPAYVVDATDDGDVAALAGARYDVGRQDAGRDDRMQAVTLMFTLTGVDWPAAVRGYRVAPFGPGGGTNRRAWGYSRLMAGYRPASPDVLVRDLNFGNEDGGAVTVNAIDVLGIDGRFPSELARARAISEAETPRLIAYIRAHVPGFAQATLGRYADSIYVRETRHFAGLETLTAGDVWDGKIPADTIGLSSYPLDLHPVAAADRPAYAPIRHVYGIPFGSLVPRGFANVILASPAISASHIASGSARVIPTTIEEGEAAGAAAALAERSGHTFADLALDRPLTEALQNDVRRNGALLPAFIAMRGDERD
jgi:hypothetical protein